MMRLLLLAAAMGLCFTAAAQQYKWVDQDGRVQYGDSPPPGVKATRLRGPSGAAAAPAAPSTSGKPAAKATASEQDAAFRQRQQEAQKQAEKSAQAERDAAQKKDQCARAQEYLRSLESGLRIARTDANGERAYLDDEQRAAETGKARAMVDQACN